MRQKWTSEETAALKAGIDKYGEGKWGKILKDQIFGPILHLRSNVDLKDKWRNFAPKTSGIGSSHGVGSAQRNTKMKMYPKDMSLRKVVLSDPEIVVTKPLTLLSGTSEVSELDSIKESISRLDNAVVVAFISPKEPRGSCQTAVSMYLEKDEVAGVAGEYSDPPQELFEKGKRIEVLICEEGFSDSWYVATVINPPPPLSHLNKYYVEYETLMDDYDLSYPLKELVDANLVRPICPITFAGSFRVDDIVDALYYDGWWIGIVTKALSNSRFKVKFTEPLAEHTFHVSELRLHMDWVNRKWIIPRTQTKKREIRELDSDTTKIVKKRGRPPKIQKSSTGNEGIAGVGTAEEIKEKRCEANGFAPISVGLARYELRSCRGKVSYPGVRIVEGTEETDCEMENNAPMLDLLTSYGAKIPQDSNPCQPSPDESQTFITDQKGEENVSPRITIEKNTANHLSKQSTELLKLSRMQIPTESCEKAECVLSSDNLGRHYLHRGGKTSVDTFTESPHFIVDGVETVKGRGKIDCETEEVAPMLILTCDGMSGPRHKISCQSPLERSQAFMSDQIGEGNGPARLIIEESADNNMTKQMETSQESLEPRSMMDIPSGSIEKAKCVVTSDNLGKHYARKRRNASANPSTESPHSFVEGISSKETEVCTVAANSNPGISPDVNQILPFKKTIRLWDSVESMKVFQLFPQKPHFRLLEHSDEDWREGLALGQMVTFSKIVKKIAEMRGDMPRCSIEKCLADLIVFEKNGFDVRAIRDRLKHVELQSRITEFKEKKRKINEDVDEIGKKLKESQAKRETAMLKMEMEDFAIEASRSRCNNIKDRMKSILFDFKEMAAARCDTLQNNTRENASINSRKRSRKRKRSGGNGNDMKLD